MYKSSVEIGYNVSMQEKNRYSTRVGALAKKVGMTRMELNDKIIPVTILAFEDCHVVKHQVSSAGHAALIGIGTKKNANKAQMIDGKAIKKLKEFRTHLALPDVGSKIEASYFEVGQKVDISGTSKGKGFQGGMKRHGFHGLRATHGVSVSHRSLGSTGNRTTPGRVMPERKMPGHMGCERVTTQGLRVVYVDMEHNVIGVKGCVSGCTNSYVEIRDTVK